jgi:hypothetical protein
MTSRDFCYWLQGFMELSVASEQTGIHVGLTVEQTRLISRHLNLVFAHEIDPSQGPPFHQAVLNQIHGSDPNAPRPRC